MGIENTLRKMRHILLPPSLFRHSCFSSYTSDQKQSLSVLNLETDELTDFADDRLAMAGWAVKAETLSSRGVYQVFLKQIAVKHLMSQPL